MTSSARAVRIVILIIFAHHGHDKINNAAAGEGVDDANAVATLLCAVFIDEVTMVLFAVAVMTRILERS